MLNTLDIQTSTCLIFLHFFYTVQITVASKFLLLQESVRDAADLYLSLKYPPHLFVLDTLCGFSRHVNLREPDLAAKFCGDTLGCFEKPSQPNQVYFLQLMIYFVLCNFLLWSKMFRRCESAYIMTKYIFVTIKLNNSKSIYLIVDIHWTRDATTRRDFSIFADR